MIFAELVHKVRYFFGFGRHWTEGLPDHQPDLGDADIRRSVETGQRSIKIHLERIAAEQNQKKGRHAKPDDLPTLDEDPTETQIDTMINEGEPVQVEGP